MKKFLSVLLTVICAVLTLSLAACGEESAAPPTGTGEESTVPPTDSGDKKPTDGGSKTLVVYFSATGSTRRVAGYIASATGGDLFELVPVNAYSSADLNWTDDSSRVVREHDDEKLRDIELTQNTVANWSSYDTVVGYPIWWGIAA